jgi:hemerythrin-like domain-containing protein
MAKNRSNADQQDAIDLLIEDHEKVDKLFKEFEDADRDDDETRSRIVEQACMELKVHSMLEQEVFYPAIRAEVEDDEDEDLLNEAEVEHSTVDELVAKVEGLEAGDPLWAAHFTVLSEYVKHHVEEEEKEMFPRVRKMKELDLEELGNEMKERKESLMAELGDAAAMDEDADEEDEDTEVSAETESEGARRSRTKR